MNLAETLRLIAAKSPNTSGEAIRALRAVNRPDSRPIQHALESALSDPLASFTAEDRTTITAHLSVGDSDARTLDVRLRVNADEKQQIQAMADEAEMSVSNLIRDRLGLPLVD